VERAVTNDNTTRDTDRVWELMKKIGFAMLVTRNGEKLRAPPMSAILDQKYVSITGTRPDLGDNRKVVT
jgi:hypothetical protein